MGRHRAAGAGRPRVTPDTANWTAIGRTFQICFALVGSTVFGRAVSSVFMGLHPPRVPTRMFGTFEEALTWIRQTAKTR